MRTNVIRARVVGGGIFLLRGESDLIEMSEAPYDSEAILQELLARYPRLLAGDQLGDGVARRWMLVKRELSLASEEGGGGRWSVDHLFLDQDAIPTLVEVKRSSSSEIRRAIVGQLLDYAANAVVYWPVERLRASFEATCEADGVGPDERLAELLGNDEEPDDYWQRVGTNLQAERVRLVFVADEIPAELRRVIEFLNGQMTPAEVIGVEVKQYLGEGLTTLVPRVVGQTAEAQQRKRGSSRPRRTDWTWDLYAQELNVPRARIEVGSALVHALVEAADARDLSLTVNYIKGYVSFLRAGGYKVAGVDVFWRKVPRFAVKIPAAPAELGLVNPYPGLTEDWDSQEREWGWTVPVVDAVPDVGIALDLAAPFHPGAGPMAAP